MKNYQRLIFIVIALVLVINILRKKNNSSEIEKPQNTIYAYNSNQKPENFIALGELENLGDYNDPFLKHVSHSTSLKTSTNLIANKTPEFIKKIINPDNISKVVIKPNILYKGVISSNDRRLGIIEYNGKELLVSQLDEVDGFIIQGINDIEIQVKLSDSLFHFYK